MVFGGGKKVFGSGRRASISIASSVYDLIGEKSITTVVKMAKR